MVVKATDGAGNAARTVFSWFDIGPGVLILETGAREHYAVGDQVACQFDGWVPGQQVACNASGLPPRLSLTAAPG
jgi:hypothetical protein